MENSSFYKNQINQVSAELQSIRDKSKQYANYLSLLEKFSEIIDDTNNSIKGAYLAFLDGGYVSDGNTLDNGLLLSNYDNLNKDLSVIDMLSKNISYNIEDFNNQVYSLEKKLDQLTEKYNEALRLER
ncbi:MAG: hypothetical protein Q4E69_01490 [Bacilli bacterium]|nr:hypothetical protein [Bacilli bacterium]